MFKRLFGSTARANHAITNSIYEEIVATARRPAYYSHIGVPDTPLGRFEMLSLHMILFLHRMRGQEGPAADLAQQLTDMFFQDVDHSIRELGIGDIGVPKRMKKLAKMFYGRAMSYGEAIDDNDILALSEALARNVMPETGNWAGADDLARAVIAMNQHLQGLDIADILAGRISFGGESESPA